MIVNRTINEDLPILDKKRVDKTINCYIKKYQSVFFDLLFLSEIIKPKLNFRHISFPDPIEDLVIGFREYYSRSSLILPVQYKKQEVDSSERLYKFFLFIYVFGIVLDECPESDRLYLLKQFSDKCRKNPCQSHVLRQIRGFYHELKTIFFFLYCNYKIDSLPEKEKKQIPCTSPVDAILSHIETRDIINLQCKSISMQIGHPITSDEASRFYELLINDRLYVDLYPLDRDYSVEFTFPEPLNQKCYTANMLLNDIKQNKSKVKLSKFSGISKIRSEEDRKQKRLIGFTTPQLPRHQHVIILHSLHKNTMDASLKEEIKKKISRQQNQKLDNNPIIYSFELYGPQKDSSGWSNWIMTSEDLAFKAETYPALTVLSPHLYIVSWDKIMADFLYRRWLTPRSDVK